MFDMANNNSNEWSRFIYEQKNAFSISAKYESRLGSRGMGIFCLFVSYEMKVTKMYWNFSKAKETKNGFN